MHGMNSPKVIAARKNKTPTGTIISGPCANITGGDRLKGGLCLASRDSYYRYTARRLRSLEHI